MSSGRTSTRINPCTNCRRRRIKCDGARPKCGPCARSRVFEDCEYAEGGRTTGQRLEEQIALVEARIEELENPRELAVRLQNSNAVSSSLSSSSGHLPQPYHEPLRRPASLSMAELGPLIDAFLQHCSQFGFFLNVDRFRDTAMGRSGQRPTAFLLDVVNLWAIHISGEDRFTSYEASYLSKALRTAVDALSGTHHQNTILHTTQAEVLLAHYFLRNARFLEGKYHITRAVSLAVSSRFHRIRSGDSDPSAWRGALGSRRLPPPRDVIEEAERINAFWTVLAMDYAWTTADGSVPNLSQTGVDARIDTPWPLDINSPNLHHQILPETSVGTVTNFLANLPDDAVSVVALHAKAAILFQQAAQLAVQYRPDMNHEQLNQFFRALNSVERLIDGFKTTLPVLNSHPTREMLIIYGLVHVATIQLHNPFVVDVEPSRMRVLASARAVVAALAQLPVNEFVFIDPIMGTLFMATCQAFITELQRFKRHRPRPWSGHVPQEELALTNAIDTVLAAMSFFATRCPLMESQLETMRQLYHAL